MSQYKVEFKMKLCDENYFSSIFEKIIRKERGENVKKKNQKKKKNER